MKELLLLLAGIGQSGGWKERGSMGGGYLSRCDSRYGRSMKQLLQW